MVMKIEVIQIKASGFGKQYFKLRNKKGTLNSLPTNFKTFIKNLTRSEIFQLQSAK